MIVIDVGNSETVIGYVAGAELVRHWRLQTRPGITADELSTLLTPLLNTVPVPPAGKGEVLVASVVPAMNAPWSQVFQGSRVEFVHHQLPFTITIALPQPNQVGADRLVNAEAVYQLYLYGRPQKRPAIIVDAGTATTFCALDAAGRYLGGAIAPGMQIATQALVSRAAKLAHVELVAPAHYVGKNTEEALASGAVNGHAALIDGMIDRLAAELGWSEPLTVATGGLIDRLRPQLKRVQHFDGLLTLKGLLMLGQRVFQ